MVTRPLLFSKCGGSVPNIFTYSPSTRLVLVSYVGDGTENRAIIGAGFPPQYVRIWRRPTIAGNELSHAYEKVGQDWETWANTFYTDAIMSQTTWHIQGRIISLDADGFTVSDAGVDAHPNKTGHIYDALCIG